MTRASELADCGHRPNCVSSNATNPRRLVGPWRLRGEPDAVWTAVSELVRKTPRTRVVETSDHYLHAEARSRILGFVDDLELALDAENGVLAVRSASRIGYSDCGVNRRRVERLRRMLVEHGVIEA